MIQFLKTKNRSFFLSLITVFVGITFYSKAQTPNFTWISGANALAQVGNYGTKGVTAPTNMPGARGEGVTWTDNSGNFWLFGGILNTTSSGYLNDLWKYNISTNEWTWMSGSNSTTQFGIYGTKGVASSSNTPGARKEGITWVDNLGNLWMFGGIGYDAASGNTGFLCDMWKYDIITNQWTWMHGSSVKDQMGTYGTKGVASATNLPPSRFLSMAWKDLTGNFWMFGGSGATGITQDMWKYDVTINQWTWISGTILGSQNGTYGTKGIMNASNLPGSRTLSRTFRDNSGNFWLYGGTGWDAANTFQLPLGDLWKYDVVANQWVWMNGSNTSNLIANYGTLGVSSPTNDVGSRTSSLGWTDNNGEFWLFGGLGNKPSSGGLFNDLWKYSVSANEWVWKAGTNLQNQYANYGTKGVTAPSNLPGGRDLGYTWKDANGYLWFFGGAAYCTSGFPDYINDLWKIDPTGLAAGIGENKSSSVQLNVYPNPNTGEFTIKGNESGSILISNELGQITKTIELNSVNNYSEKITIEKSGIYFVCGKGLNQKIVVIK